ncbi:calpain-5-like isoform X1 [Brachionus plicatilis]|uniref:Calpain-5-like isoform X1 n=1 Tax=Brachionus plicatilis TaxID=10195 RepID=A0A3M7RGM0_BRAPC|nr:calpain-5-like isoform X1 [Brachionus plicatilis]
MSKTKSFLDQDYERLKSKAKSSGELFVDDKFGADDSSIFRFKNFLGKKVYWKRAREIVQDPKFIVNKIEPNDLDQGKVGDCWMIAAGSCVLNSPELIKRTIPTEQTFDEPDYAGIFHFKFWVNGEWLDVVVDDYLPVDESNKLLFCKNLVETNEMYGPLFEKAYAKLNICYEFLVVGYPHDALVDFTGGVNEVYDLSFSRASAAKEKREF